MYHPMYHLSLLLDVARMDFQAQIDDTNWYSGHPATKFHDIPAWVTSVLVSLVAWPRIFENEGPKMEELSVNICEFSEKNMLDCWMIWMCLNGEKTRMCKIAHETAQKKQP